MADTKPRLRAVQSVASPVALERRGGAPHYNRHWYVGTREELIAAGVVDDRLFPGEAGAIGKRGERFVDVSGRRCVISRRKTPRHRPPTFQVSIYMLPPERDQLRAERDKERKAAEAALAVHAAEAQKEKARRTAELLSPDEYRRALNSWMNCLLTAVGEGNRTYASMAGESAATVHLDGAEAEPILEMLRQVKARIAAAHIVSCTANVATDARPGHLRVAWSAPANT